MLREIKRVTASRKINDLSYESYVSCLPFIKIIKKQTAYLGLFPPFFRAHPFTKRIYCLWVNCSWIALHS